MTEKCLLIVDVQNDFCPGGALPVPAGDSIISTINRILPQFKLVIATRDMHPKHTAHFNNWPPHCIVGTQGAAFHPALHVDGVHLFAEKGTGNADDGYSAFEATNMDLAETLREHHIHEVTICGLATDYCIKKTALDAIRHGFHAIVLTDCVKAVNLRPEDGGNALSEMASAGVRLAVSDSLRDK